MKELKNSKTFDNLFTALVGESLAATKYDWFSQQAKKDGYVQISDIFKNTADNERAHGKLWFEFLNDEKIPDTKTNLSVAVEGEHYEWSAMYKEFAETAKQEGFYDIAEKMSGVAAIEAEHEARYKQLLQNIENSQVFSRDSQQYWICQNCGHIHYGVSAPAVCPVCTHTKAYFEIKAENY